MTEKVIDEWRPEGSRNFIRVGDVVKVLPSRPHKRDGFEAKVQGIVTDADTGEVKYLQVLGGPRGQLAFRSIRPDRIERVAQFRTNPIEGKVRRQRKR